MWVIAPPIRLGVWSMAVAAFCIVCVCVPAPECHNYVETKGLRLCKVGDYLCSHGGRHTACRIILCLCFIRTNTHC